MMSAAISDQWCHVQRLRSFNVLSGCATTSTLPITMMFQICFRIWLGILKMLSSTTATIVPLRWGCYYITVTIFLSLCKVKQAHAICRSRNVVVS